MALPPVPTLKLQGLNTAYTIATKDGKPDPNFIIQFNTLVGNLVSAFNAAVVAFNTATAAQVSANTAQDTANTAQDGVDALAADQYIIAAPSPDLTNARVIEGGLGVTFDTATAAQIKILVNALLILNGAPVALTEALSTSSTLDVTGAAALHGGLAVTGGTVTDTLQINQAVTVATTAQVGYVMINLNGVNTKVLTG